MDLWPISPGATALIVILLTVGILASRTMAKANNETEGGALLKLPLIGDLHSSPKDKPLLNWDAWAKQNGPLPTPKLFGIVPMVIINTAEAVTELFSHRSQWYSNRPPSVTMEMITDAEPGRCKFSLMHDYDDHLKLQHRLLSPSLGAVSAPRYQPLMELETAQLLRDTLQLVSAKSDNVTTMTAVYPLLERTQSSMILSLHYGMRIATPDEPILHQIIDIQQRITHLAANPQMPDFVPALRHLPKMLSPWKRFADNLYAEQVELYTQLFEHGKAAEGWNATKAATDTGKNSGVKSVSDLDVIFSLATSIQGGMETSPRQILWLFAAGVLNPAWWARAQEVLDQVVGRDRLPNFQDRSKLAYLDAVAHELLRWRPIAPGSIPRRADKEDEWNGVKIVKGATLIANAWAIGRDEAVFDPALGDVGEFIPERWLVDDQSKLRTDLPLPVFGQGKRMCLGKRVAVDGTFLQVTRLIWAFDVEKVDEIDPWAMDVVGFMTVPRNRQFKLRPRGPWVADVLKATAK